MNMQISGSGKISSGEYENISISGSCDIEGPVRCETLRCSGSVSGHGRIVCTGHAQFSGSVGLDDTIEANAVEASGSFSGTGINARGEVRISGATRLSGDVEGETVCVGGVIVTPGLINGETVEISAGGSSVGAIGGSRITVRKKYDDGNIVIRRFSLFHRKNDKTLTVRDSIEGDDIELENTICPRVSGKRVVIGDGCRIEKVYYSESCDVSPDAKVGETIKN